MDAPQTEWTTCVAHAPAAGRVRCWCRAAPCPCIARRVARRRGYPSHQFLFAAACATLRDLSITWRTRAQVDRWDRWAPERFRSAAGKKSMGCSPEQKMGCGWLWRLPHGLTCLKTVHSAIRAFAGGPKALRPKADGSVCRANAVESRAVSPQSCRRKALFAPTKSNFQVA